MFRKIYSRRLLLQSGLGATTLGVARSLMPPLLSAKSAKSLVAAESDLAWLEERTGVAALEWVVRQNKRTIEEFCTGTEFAQSVRIAQRLLAEPVNLSSQVLNGDWIYDFVQTKDNPRGTLRRTTVVSFEGGAAEWKTLLDVDALGRSEGRKWSFETHLQSAFSPNGNRLLVRLLDARSRVPTIRELDLNRRQFVAKGFSVSGAEMERLTSAVWVGDDALLVTVEEVGAGDRVLWSSTELTSVKYWSRGIPLGKASRLSLTSGPFRSGHLLAFPDARGECCYVLRSVRQGRDMEYHLVTQEGQLSRMNIPSSTPNLIRHEGQWIIPLWEDWTVSGRRWGGGAIVSIAETDISSDTPSVHPVMEAGDREMIYPQMMPTAGGIFVVKYRNVRAELLRLSYCGSAWVARRINLPDTGTIKLTAGDRLGEKVYVTYEDFLQPPTLYQVSNGSSPIKFRQVSPAFDSTKYLIEQYEAPSADGTLVPYFVVRARSMQFDGNSPTLMWGYGANGAIESPRYDKVMGPLWLERGGVYVVANIRGGGELGRQWHLDAIRANRQRAYDDFIAVAEDLHRRQITSPRRLGIYGASNGGLLVGVVINQRPDLFKAAVMQAGILDTLKIFDPSAIAERGSPDIPEERAFLEETSPYHNIRKNPDFPTPLIALSTTDDQVHPSMSRKYAAKLERLGMPYYYYESPEGGHGMGLTPERRAFWEALRYAYLWNRLL